MARYIDADRLKEKKYYDKKRHEYCVSIAEVDWQSTANVQEVKHGKWMYEDYECSVCGESLSSIMDSDSYFQEILTVVIIARTVALKWKRSEADD